MATNVIIKHFPALGYRRAHWSICHAQSYQNAFRQSVNMFTSRDKAVEFAESHGCVVQLHLDDALQKEGTK